MKQKCTELYQPVITVWKLTDRLNTRTAAAKESYGLLQNWMASETLGGTSVIPYWKVRAL